MPTFRYQHGDRPLDGYTIEHGVGRGGFGEVYYAVSDSGREVALKAVQNYEDVELRGIRHCMNLKSPYLVTIFDVKRNEGSEPFVIMEFVSGPSLRQLLDQSPNGLGSVKAAYLLREIAKGLSYLHDCGIVHRDMKPHNVFYEDGFVKIGDYSLSKVISSSHRSAHTMTVGSVHYMAPEVSMGRYDHCVDLYALGAMLYEMLTGRPPFIGESVGEVLMKHMSAEVDVRGIEEPFASVVQKALAKDPSDRYQSAQELVEAVFGAEQIQDGVTAFNPNTLSVVAGKVAGKVPAVGVAAVATQPYSPVEVDSPPAPAAPREHHEPGGFAVQMRKAAEQCACCVGAVAPEHATCVESVNDPLSHRHRVTLALISAVVMATGAAWLGSDPSSGVSVYAFFVIAALWSGIGITRRWIQPRLQHESSLLYRLAQGGVCLLTLFPVYWFASTTNLREASIGVLLPMFALDWRVMSGPIRAQRLSMPPTVFAAILGAIGAAFCDSVAILGASIAAGVALTVQVASPFDPVASKKYAPERTWWQSFWDALVTSRPGEKELAPQPVPTAEPADVVELVDAEPVSPRLRLVSLLLSLLPFFPGIPICGLHRFYAGKIGTGILWFFTLGFLYVGQLIDVILIALGAFRDSEERRVLAWTSTSEGTQVPNQKQYATPVNQYSSVPVSGSGMPGLGSVVLATVGGILLVAALTVGFALAAQVPWAVAAGVFDPVIQSGEIEAALGMSDWPRLVTQICGILTGTIAVCAVCMLLAARRGSGILHMLRLLIGFCGLFVALAPVWAAFDMVRWPDIAEHLSNEKIGPAIDAVLNAGYGGFIPAMFGASLILVFSVFVLAWPAKRRVVRIAPVRQLQPEVIEK